MTKYEETDMSKRFIESILCGDVWKVLIYDNGLVKMSELDSEKNAFVDCTFATKEEADEAGRKYEESWN